MPRIKRTNGYTTVHISANETYEFARRWPCSTLKGRRVRAQFESNGDLVELAVDGREGFDCPVDEFDALIERYVGTAHPTA